MNEPETKTARRSRGKYWLAGALVVVLIAATGTWYVLSSDKEDGLCAPRQPTGVTKPVKATKDGASEKWFTVVDTGFMPYQREGAVASPDEGVSFGYIVENPSKYVLYDARLRVRFETPDGRNPTEHVNEGDQEENSTYIDDVELPVLFPGERSGLGGKAHTWTSSYLEDETGELRQPEQVDYSSLRMSVELVSGEWWKVHNDRYEFGEVSASHTEAVDTEPSEYISDFDENPAAVTEVEYDVDVSICREHRAYGASLLVYNKDDEIVGGTISGGLVDASYEPNNKQHGSAIKISIPARDVTYKAYPYAEPVKPKLA